MSKYYVNPFLINPEGIIRKEQEEKDKTIWFFDCRQIMNGFKFTKKASKFRMEVNYIEVAFDKTTPESIFAGNGPRFLFLGLAPDNSDMILEFRKLWDGKKLGKFVGFGYFRDLEYTKNSRKVSYIPEGYEEENDKLKDMILAQDALEKRFKDAGFEF